MADRITAGARTRRAIQAANEGELGDARTLLVEALTADREYAPAWLWFGAVAQEPGERLYCLQEAQRLQPSSATALAIRDLGDTEPKVPDELKPFTDPPPPELVETFQEDALARRRRNRIISWSIVAAVVVLTLLASMFISTDKRETVYFAVVASSAEQPGPGTGQEQEAAAAWAAREFTESNRLPDHRIETVYFNDSGDPELARRIAENIVADGRFLGVIGHSNTVTSEAAAPVYREAGMPAITPSATGDALTEDNPWYFRTIFNNTAQGRGISDYAKVFLPAGSAAIITTDSPYGETLAAGFRTAWTAGDAEVVAEVVIPVDDDGAALDEAAVADAVAKVAAARPTGPLFLGVRPALGEPLIKGLRAADLDNPIVAGDALTTAALYQDLTIGSQALAPDTLDRVYGATPLTTEGLTGEAVTFYDEFAQAVGYQPSWEAGLTYDALDVFAESLIRAEAPMTVESRAADREAIRNELTQANKPQTAFPALTNPIYFDSTQSAVRPVSMQVGYLSGNEVGITAARNQLVPYSPDAGLTLEQATADGSAAVIEGRAYTKQRIVDVGVNINELSRLDTSTQSFNADFFVWLRYSGGDDAADLYFPNAVEPSLDLGDPVRKSTTDGETYALYAVEGEFTSPMSFKDFPFDQQNLTISMGNAKLPSARIAYTPDPLLLQTSQAERLTSGVDSGATIDSIQNWGADSVNFYPRSVGNTASLGDPLAVSGPGGVTFSQTVTDVSIARDVSSFLVKNILPLALLVLVTFLSLWLPIGEASRVTFAVTGILTGAVMLNSVTSSLADIEYTVAIEWAYYAFIVLSGIMLLLTLIGRHFNEQRKLASLRKLQSFAKIFFVVFVAITVLAYVVKFG